MESVQKVLEAALFAAERHADQKRKGAAAEPYVNHVIEVAHLISTALDEPDDKLIAAALLHDVVEDAGVTEAELTERFGPDVAALVLEVTDDKTLPKSERKRLQIANAPRKSVRAQAIKLADKISNLRSMQSSPPAGWDRQRIEEYVEWATRVVHALPSPNPILKAEFERTLLRFDQAVRP
jgi:(p)ppGpp synthase/HD superfamily hydrolase